MEFSDDDDLGFLIQVERLEKRNKIKSLNDKRSKLAIELRELKQRKKGKLDQLLSKLMSRQINDNEIIINDVKEIRDSYNNAEQSLEERIKNISHEIKSIEEGKELTVS